MGYYRSKLVISEQERNHIRSLYGLITEVETPVTKETASSGLKFDKTINFPPGYYRTKGSITTKAGTTYDWDVDQTIKADLEKVKEFLKNNPTGYIVEVNLYSGESQIPNNDNEEGGKRINQNELNTSRLNTLKTYIQPIFDSWKAEGITQTDFKINEYKEVGKTPWVGTPFCPENTTDPRTCSTTYYNKVAAKDSVALDYKNKYDAEQYFRIIIEVKKVEPPTTTETTKSGTSSNNENVTPECATNLEIVVYVKSHRCQNAEYLVYANNTLLTNLAGGNTANLNNADGYLFPKNFNFPVPAEGGSYLVDMSEGGKTNAFERDTELIAQVLNPAYGYTKNGPYTPDESGDISKSRSDTFKVTAEQSKTIIEQGNGKINIWLVGTTKSMHLDIPYVLIKKDGKTVYDGQPKIEKGLVLTLSGCGNEVINKDTTATAPTGYEQILVQMFKDRLDAVKKGFKDPDVIKKLSKKQKIDVKSVLLERTKALNDFIQQVYQIYRDANDKSKTVGEMRKIYNSTGNKVARTNIFNQIQLELDGNPSFRKMDPSNGWVSTYVDPNIEASRKKPEKTLLGDVFLKLQEFYQYYKYFYFDTDSDTYVKEGLPLDSLEKLPSEV